MISKSDMLWVKILQAKYFPENVETFVCFRVRRCSHVWRAIMHVWPKLLSDVRWDIVDGMLAKF